MDDVKRHPTTDPRPECENKRRMCDLYPLRKIIYHVFGNYCNTTETRSNVNIGRIRLWLDKIFSLESKVLRDQINTSLFVTPELYKVCGTVRDPLLTF